MSKPTDGILEHPRVVAASNELFAAAEAYAAEKEKEPKESCYRAWCKCTERLENAAIRFTNTVSEYKVKASDDHG